jgi:D-alanyl-D-alanine carboxypeptidase
VEPAGVDAKIYTALVALLQLGPSHRPVTEVFRNGRVTRGGTLAGDLELVGPAGLLSPRELETLARNVARRGIRRVAGALSACSASEGAARSQPGLRGSETASVVWPPV